MMDAAHAGESRRRGKKNRGKPGRRKRSSKPRGNRNSQQKERYSPEFIRDDSSILGRRVPVVQERRPTRDETLDAFSLFCAYCLGITPDERFHEPRLDEVARRFGKSSAEIKEHLKEFGLDQESIRASNFDMIGAKLDIKLAPEGISRIESARDLFEEFQSLRSSVG